MAVTLAAARDWRFSIPDRFGRPFCHARRHPAVVRAAWCFSWSLHRLGDGHRCGEARRGRRSNGVARSIRSAETQRKRMRLASLRALSALASWLFAQLLGRLSRTRVQAARTDALGPLRRRRSHVTRAGRCWARWPWSSQRHHRGRRSTSGSRPSRHPRRGSQTARSPSLQMCEDEPGVSREHRSHLLSQRPLYPPLDRSSTWPMPPVSWQSACVKPGCRSSRVVSNSSGVPAAHACGREAVG
jgi:hypothetical protein